MTMIRRPIADNMIAAFPVAWRLILNLLVILPFCCLLEARASGAKLRARAPISQPAPERHFQQTHVQHRHSPLKRDVEAKTQIAEKSIPDLALRDQDGRRVRVYSDLMRGKTVVINTMFTTCVDICPILGKNLSELRKVLADRLGRDVSIISITIEPAIDTPTRLKSWGAKFGAGPGWTFVTGERADIDKLLTALTGDVARRENHSPVLIIRNDATGKWIRPYAFESPSVLLKLIDEVSSH
jgi:protein SCO1/2